MGKPVPQAERMSGARPRDFLPSNRVHRHSDRVSHRGPLQPVAAIMIETWIDRIGRMKNQTILFILSILCIHVRQESKVGHGWQTQSTIHQSASSFPFVSIRVHLWFFVPLRGSSCPFVDILFPWLVGLRHGLASSSEQKLPAPSEMPGYEPVWCRSTPR